MAASISASDSVGWAWMVCAISRAVAPICMASAGLGDQLARARPHDVHAQDLAAPAIRRLFADHAHLPFALAHRQRPAVHAKGKAAHLHVQPCSLASSSVRPTSAISGMVKMQLGTTR